ncbi:MAG: SpoIID/LytB domain-containing protein [Cyanobacteria bacterium P01_H01_bin.15]
MVTNSKKRDRKWRLVGWATISWFAWIGPGIAAEAELAVGVVQRFGGDERPKTLQISTIGEGNLTVNFQVPELGPQTLTTDALTITIVDEPLEAPVLRETLILSDRATFETAENSSKEWAKLGIPTEVTQPGRWQVWAKRDVYNTPLLRRLLLDSLQAKGYDGPYLDSEIKTTEPAVRLTIGETVVEPENLVIAASNDRMRVQLGDKVDKAKVYGGNLELISNAYGNFTLVNNIGIETYLRGVVPHEIGPGAPQAAVEAQTIVARTYALRNVRRFKADGYQLCATVHCQVYYGLSGTIDRIDEAITATAGKVLTYQGQLVDALYSSTSGGVTSNFADIWDGENRPYLTSVIDAPKALWDLETEDLSSEDAFRRFIALADGFNEDGRSAFRWNKPSTLSELGADLQAYLKKRKHPLADFQELKTLEITERSPSGRILALNATTDIGTIALYKTEVRSAFGPPRSTLFYLEPITDATGALTGYAFVGGGFGHGVGMSQYGSYNLANLGWDAAKILKFYYPNTQITPLNATGAAALQ